MLRWNSKYYKMWFTSLVLTMSHKGILNLPYSFGYLPLVLHYMGIITRTYNMEPFMDVCTYMTPLQKK